MALIKGKLIDPSTAIKQSADPVSNEDLARKGYVDSKASAEAVAAKVEAKSYADQKISDLVNGAPAMLDTLKELADALQAGEAQLSQEILTQIGLVDDRIDQEILDRQSGDNALDGRLDVLEGSESTEGSVAKAKKDAKDYADSKVAVEKSRAEGEESRIESKVDQEILDRQSAVSAEQQARESADSALDGRLDVLEGSESTEGSVAKAKKDAKDYADSKFSAEKSRAEGEESRIEGKVDQEILDRQSAVSAEQSARQAADSGLSGRLDVLEQDPTTKNYVDGKFSAANSYTDQKVSDLVNGAPAMLDTLKELADAIESSSGSLTQDILTQVGAVDDRVDQEILDRQAADLVLDGKITTEKNRAEGEEARIEGKIDQEVLDRQSADSALDGRLDVLEGSESTEGSVAKAKKDAKDYADSKFSQEQSRAQGEESRIEGKVDAETSARQSAVSAEQSRAQGEESRIEGKIDQEISNRQSAVSAEQSRAQAAESALDGRVTTLETAPKPRGRKEVKTMSATNISNGYVDMAEEAMPKTMFVSVSGTVQYEDEDYTLSTVGGKTRVTFIGDLTPDGDGAALVAGDKVYCQYLVMSTSEQPVGPVINYYTVGTGSVTPASPSNTAPNIVGYQITERILDGQEILGIKVTNDKSWIPSTYMMQSSSDGQTWTDMFEYPYPWSANQTDQINNPPGSNKKYRIKLINSSGSSEWFYFRTTL